MLIGRIIKTKDSSSVLGIGLCVCFNLDCESKLLHYILNNISVVQHGSWLYSDICDKFLLNIDDFININEIKIERVFQDTSYDTVGKEYVLQAVLSRYPGQAGIFIDKNLYSQTALNKGKGGTGGRRFTSTANSWENYTSTAYASSIRGLSDNYVLYRIESR